MGLSRSPLGGSWSFGLREQGLAEEPLLRELYQRRFHWADMRLTSGPGRINGSPVSMLIAWYLPRRWPGKAEKLLLRELYQPRVHWSRQWTGPN